MGVATDKFKPKGFENHLTLGEVAQACLRDPARIKQLEARGIISAPVRATFGKLKVRLYAPDEVAKIQEHFKTAKAGRPKQRR